MADRAVLRKSRGRVVGVGGLVVRVQVAGRALSRRPGKAVIGVTLGARGLDMDTGQRKAGLGVIKRSRPPGGGVMAQPAGLGKSGGGVTRAGCLGEIAEVTSDAVRRRAREFVPDVAL